MTAHPTTTIPRASGGGHGDRSFIQFALVLEAGEAAGRVGDPQVLVQRSMSRGSCGCAHRRRLDLLPGCAIVEGVGGEASPRAVGSAVVREARAAAVWTMSLIDSRLIGLVVGAPAVEGGDTRSGGLQPTNYLPLK